jgi:hypothetical protein
VLERVFGDVWRVESQTGEPLCVLLQLHYISPVCFFTLLSEGLGPGMGLVGMVCFAR